jgi:hypothetical protein
VRARARACKRASERERDGGRAWVSKGKAGRKASYNSRDYYLLPRINFSLFENTARSALPLKNYMARIYGALLSDRKDSSPGLGGSAANDISDAGAFSQITGHPDERCPSLIVPVRPRAAPPPTRSHFPPSHRANAKYPLNANVYSQLILRHLEPLGKKEGRPKKKPGKIRQGCI